MTANRKATPMSDTIQDQMRAQLTTSLTELVEALNTVGIRTEQPHHSSVDTEVWRWEAIVWRAADILAAPDGPARRHWSRTMGLEIACRSWSRAAGAYQLYAMMASPAREDTFGLHMAPVSSNLGKWRAGMAWSV